jgi:YggT family protein
VNSTIGAFDAVLGALRVAFFVVALLLTAVCVVDWLVRTRRLNPFGQVGRFFRQTVDPLFAPMERRIVRAGGLPATAPWWMLAAVVIGGILLLTLLGFVRNQVLLVALATETGSRGLLRLVVSWVFEILTIALLVRVVSSWMGVPPNARWVGWAYKLSEPILRPLRRFIPTIGIIDVTPIVAFFLLRILQSVIVGML